MSYGREAAPTSPGRLEDLTVGLQSLLSLLAPVGLALLLTAPAQAPLSGQIVTYVTAGLTFVVRGGRNDRLLQH